MSADLTDHAIAYAAAGWEVFPLTAGKAPRFRSPHQPGHSCRGGCGQVGHGFYDATDDPDTIRSWAPWRMIAGRIGRRLLVLDIDVHGGGEDTLGRLTAEHGPLPDTLTCYSGRGDGGRHLYFVRPPGRLSGTRLRPGIDLLHHTLRYAVLPPSPHPRTGQPYRWEHHAVAPLPPWLVQLVVRPEPRLVTRPTPGRLTGPAKPGGRPPMVDVIADLAAHSSDAGSGRHDAVLYALCRAVEYGTDDDLAQVKRIAEQLGKSSDEVDAMAAWAGANVSRSA